MDYLGWKLSFIILVMIAWLAYVVIRRQQRADVFKQWGFRTDNIRTVARMIFPLCVIAVIAFILIGYAQGTINVTWHIIPILMLYPVWGIVQQFLVIAMVGGNLKAVNSGKARNTLNIVVTALLFGWIHYPYSWLMVGTFVLAIVYGLIYSRSPNILVLGVFHGWLGALFFYTVVNRDPYLEIFGRIPT